MSNKLKKILVIEDAHSLRHDIIEMLGFEGFDVIGAENGIEGVERARQLMPDLIICDIMMPIMDGYGVLETLRCQPETAAIPFIFLTARTDRFDMRQGMELGADDYLTKPFTATELLASVNTRLQKRAVISEINERKMEDLRSNIMLSLPHELRTPLNVILGFSDLLMADYNVMQPQRIGEMAHHINHAALRLYRLIENFLIYANIETVISSPEQLQTLRESTTANPAAILEYIVLNKMQQAGRESDLEINISETPAIKIIDEYFRKIAEELIDNAVKFSETQSKITVFAAEEDDYYVIKVTDNGRGMTAEQIADIGAYMQFDRRYYEQQGSGLGLVIVKRLAELFKGSINIDSEPQKGTQITVKLLRNSEHTTKS